MQDLQGIGDLFSTSHIAISKMIEALTSVGYLALFIVAYFAFDKFILKGFNTATQLKNGNLSVGIAVAGFFIGYGLLLQKAL